MPLQLCGYWPPWHTSHLCILHLSHNFLGSIFIIIFFNLLLFIFRLPHASSFGVIEKDATCRVILSMEWHVDGNLYSLQPLKQNKTKLGGPRSHVTKLALLWDMTTRFIQLCPHAAGKEGSNDNVLRQVTSLCTCAAPASTHCWATLRRLSTSRPFRASRAPSLANRMLVPAPMPELAPVIRATLPCREDTYNTRWTHRKDENKWTERQPGMKHNARAHTRALWKFDRINLLCTRRRQTFLPLNAWSTVDDVTTTSLTYPSTKHDYYLTNTFHHNSWMCTSAPFCLTKTHKINT